MVRVFLVAMLVACGSGGSSSEPGGSSSVAASAAGTVVGVQGSVSASRAGATRTLKARDQVWPDDVIDTGADGSISIELAHNNALWSLEPGIKARVDESPAWKLDKQAASRPVDHATSSAGRHAEREAADTAVTADSEAPAEAAKGSPEVGHDPPPKPTTSPTTRPEPIRSAEPKPRTPEAKPETVTKPAPGGGANCDELSCTLDPSAACCAGRKAGKVEAPRSPPRTDEQEAPDRAAIKRGIDAIRPKLSACADKVQVKGVLKLTIVVGADGKASQITIKQSPDPKIDACVLAAAKTLQLPRSRSGVTFSYPIIFD